MDQNQNPIQQKMYQVISFMNNIDNNIPSRQSYLQVGQALLTILQHKLDDTEDI
jgi:hypothetical protein